MSSRCVGWSVVIVRVLVASSLSVSITDLKHSMRPSRLSEIVVALVVGCTVSLAGCSELPLACTDELGIRFSPQSPTLAVGESVLASLELSTCGGRTRWKPTVVWRTDDTTVVAVDSTTGRITGRSVGDAIVMAVERDPVGNESTYPYPVSVR
jgi:hypothetical protein